MGVVIRPKDGEENSTKLTWISQISLKGWVPKMVVNRVTMGYPVSLCDDLTQVRKYIYRNFWYISRGISNLKCHRGLSIDATYLMQSYTDKGLHCTPWEHLPYFLYISCSLSNSNVTAAYLLMRLTLCRNTHVNYIYIYLKKNCERFFYQERYWVNGIKIFYDNVDKNLLFHSTAYRLRVEYLVFDVNLRNSWKTHT